MAKILLIDLFRVHLFPKDLTYFGDLDPLFSSKVNLPDYKFSDYFSFNTDLIDYLRLISAKIPLHLFTAAQKFLQSPEALGTLFPLFTSVISTSDMGMRKTDIESFQLICSNLAVQPAQVVYVGDNSANVETAAKAGVQTIHYTTNSQVIADLQVKITHED